MRSLPHESISAANGSNITQDEKRNVFMDDLTCGDSVRTPVPSPVHRDRPCSFPNRIPLRCGAPRRQAPPNSRGSDRLAAHYFGGDTNCKNRADRGRPSKSDRTDEHLARAATRNRADAD